MFVRSEKNPIIVPDKKIVWLSKKAYNPTVLFEDGVYHLFFRAVGTDGASRIGRARSTDGENFQITPQPVLEPSTADDSSGVEDPRISKIDERYFLAYTAYDGHTARQALAVSSDLDIWEKVGPIFPGWDIFSAGGFEVTTDAVMGDEESDRNWSKGGALFPEVVNGEYLMIFGDRELWLARSADGRHWRADGTSWLKERADGYFDCLHIEMGPPPIRTLHGWLVIYHGIDRQAVYRLGWLLLDLNDPTKILKRSREPIFEPSVPYELSGLIDISAGRVDNMSRHRVGIAGQTLDKFAKIADNNIIQPRVVFCCGACLAGDTLRIYYGAGDTCICTATAKLAELLAAD